MENLNINSDNFEEYTPTAEDFQLTQAEIKIHDKKFETKTTTFAKDAFKRFCKNKSSVVAAFIIGFLILCSIFVPIFSPYNTDQPQPSHSLLKPRLFAPGTGFWDGTETYTDKPWDALNECPSGFKANAIVPGTLVLTEGEKIDTPHAAAKGGYLRFVAEKIPRAVPEEKKYNYTKKLWNYTPITITADGEHIVEIVIGNVDGITEEKLGEFRISLTQVEYDEKGKEKKTINLSDEYEKPLYDWSTNHAPVSEDGREGVIVLNLSQYLEDLELDVVENARLQFEVVREVVPTYMLIQSIIFTASNVSPSDELLLHEVSMRDANLNILTGQKDAENNDFPIGYWRSSGLRKLYQADLGKVSFVYDVYEAQLGLVTDFYLGQSDADKYIKNGWMEYDYNVGPSSLKIIDEDRCPVIVVTDQFYNEEFERWTLVCDITYYKYQGYTSMPKYLLGATIDGKDLITLSFISLRTSLIVAFLASFICLAIGLVWGSVSGYFGGNVDLAMERFCEILSGVPFIVVMTLVILHLGNTIGVFAFGLCITGWLGVAGRTRTQFYRFKGREYILASRTLGASDTRLIFKHILPNALGTIVTGSVLMIPGVIFSESSLAYLNLGLQGVESFGVLLSKNQAYLKSDAVLILFPAAIISLLMISFNLFGNGLRDALNPSLKGSE